jgi:hypothetical protein
MKSVVWICFSGEKVGENIQKILENYLNINGFQEVFVNRISQWEDLNRIKSNPHLFIIDACCAGTGIFEKYLDPSCRFLFLGLESEIMRLKAEWGFNPKLHRIVHWEKPDEATNFLAAVKSLL